jgi:ArsR family transcriptional regulator
LTVGDDVQSAMEQKYQRENSAMKQFIRVMKALSDPNRVRVLKLLQQGELCVCEIQNLLGLAQSTVSKHMKLLEDAGLVERRRQGTWILYSLADGSESIYAETLLIELRSWLDDDAELKKMIVSLPNAAVLRMPKGTK